MRNRKVQNDRHTFENILKLIKTREKLATTLLATQPVCNNFVHATICAFKKTGNWINSMTSLVSASAGLRDGLDSSALILTNCPLGISRFYLKSRQACSRWHLEVRSQNDTKRRHKRVGRWGMHIGARVVSGNESSKSGAGQSVHVAASRRGSVST